MKRKETLLCAVIALLAILSIGIWFRFTSELMESSTIEVIGSQMRSVRSDIAKMIHEDAVSLRILAMSENFRGASDMSEAEKALLEVERSHPDSSFALIGPGGWIYKSDGTEYSVIQFEGLSESGDEFKVAGIYDKTRGSGGIALIARTSAGFECYLAAIFTMERLGERMAEAFRWQTGYVAVFDDLSDGVASMSASGKELENIEGIVSSGLSDFRDSGSEELIESFEGGSEYRAYIRLREPPGWIVGVYFPGTPLWELFSSIRWASPLFAASVTALFCVATVAAMAMRRDETKIGGYGPHGIDGLTGLGNGMSMLPMSREFMKGKNKENYSVVCVDIVSFDRFNAMFGYQSGDKLLCTVAGVLRERCHCGVRLNSDVFVAIAESGGEFVEDLNHRLSEAVANEFGPEYVRMISFKFGVCRIKNASITSGRNVFDEALLAMKEAKTMPAAKIVVYDNDLERRKQWKQNIEKQMLNALPNDEFALYIQPKWELSLDRCCGGEALVRWLSPELGFLAPDRFIPIFEENQFIIEVDFFMLSKVLKMLQREIDSDAKARPIAVNVSKVTMMFPNYIDRLSNTIGKFRVPSSLVELEITESALSGTDYRSVRSLMHDMKDMGFTIAMDDFGVGYSSFNTLRELPVDVLKIDKEFLDDATESKRSRTIIKSIVDMAKSIGIKVVCEGIETASQLDFLKSVGCDYGQGYLFSEPVTCYEFEKKYAKDE
ncbi:MAG: bifunctional diguanylate cyclase/phosphodiesterase [Synergistaceae bacterium]|jgi:EAL domain-containing protein (putative c-di-GMP-specific phosphodiesterase class I)/GGDEF domain-containing protein|nr:bifunctional diguanylate cyclase/phosphodiesterase [Synergistaceae bacterium]